MMKIKSKLMTLAVILFVSTSQASELSSATIKRLMLDRSSPGWLFIQLSTHQSSPVGCHTITGWEYVLDITDDQGKQMYSSLITLYVSGKPGLFRGTDLCSLHGNIETLGRLELK